MHRQLHPQTPYSTVSRRGPDRVRSRPLPDFFTVLAVAQYDLNTVFDRQCSARNIPTVDVTLSESAPIISRSRP